MSDSKMLQVLDRLHRLPSLSMAVMDLLESFERENLDIPQLVGKISCDQALTARVLRVANSAFYGLPSQVGSINEAVVVLGFNNVRSLAMTAGIIDHLSFGAYKADCLAFWRHSIGAGVCARVLAGDVGLNQEIAFTAGLLHDIGRLVLAIHFPEDFGRRLVFCAAEDCEFSEAEKRLGEINHAAIGYELAKRWRFPPAIQLAIYHHHEPGTGVSGTLTDVVHVADVLSHALDIGSTAPGLVPQMSQQAWRRLGISWTALKAHFHEIERLNTAANLLLAGAG